MGQNLVMKFLSSHRALSRDAQDSCSVSLIIPKTSIKSSCSDVNKFDHKIRSIEGQFAVLRRVINEIQAQVTYKLSSDSQAQAIGEIKQKINAIEKDIIPQQEERIDKLESETFSKIQQRLQTIEAENSEFDDYWYTTHQGRHRQPRMLVPSGRELFQLMQPHIQSEINKMKAEIKAEILEELNKELGISSGRSNTRHHRRDIGEPESVTSTASQLGHTDSEQDNPTIDTQYLKHDDGMDGRETKSDETKSDETKSEFDKHLEQLMQSFQSDARTHSKRSNRRRKKGGTYDNELPENDIGEGVLQSDIQPHVGIYRTFEAFRQEINLAFRHETERVKSITNSHAVSVEEKLTQILKIIESLKAHYDEQLREIEFHQGVTGTNNKVEKMEENISNLAKNISALKENILTDSKLRRLLHQEQVSIQNQIYAELAGMTDPMKNDIGYLTEQFKVDHKLQGVLETTLQNFKADIRLKMHFVEKNVSRLVKQIDELNSTINVDYGEDFDMDKAQEHLKTMHAVDFVYEIKDKWPYIETNFSRIEEMHTNDIEARDTIVKTLHNDLQYLKVNNSEMELQISDVNTKVSILNETVTKLENNRMKAALNNNEWVEYNFKHTFARSACYGGKQYVKKTRYKSGQFVGVVTCSRSKYKIYLSDSLKDVFLDIGDTRHFGEDHCEFVGGRRRLNVNIDKNTHQFSRIPGYKRADWGQTPIKGTLNFFSPTPMWYECGVNIP